MDKKLILLLPFILIHILASSQILSVSVFADMTEICEGDSVKLNLRVETTGTPTLEVSWSPISNINTQSDDSPWVSPKQTTVYTVNVTDLDNDISLSAKIKISVVPLPIVVAPLNDTVCINEVVRLSPSKFDNSLDPSWSHNGKGSLKYYANSLNVDYIPAVNELGEVTCILRGSGIGICNDAVDTTIITYVEAPEASIITTTNLVCANQSLQIEGELSNYSDFCWEHSGIGELVDNTTLNPIYVPAAKESGKVSLILSAFGNGCNHSDTLIFYVGLKPEIKLPSDLLLCSNERCKIIPSVNKNIDTPVWKHNGQGEFLFTSDSTTVTYKPALNEVGEVMVSVFGNSADGCGSVADTIYITYLEATEAKINLADTLVCGNEQLEIFGDTINAVSFEWTHNGNGELTNTNSLNPTYIPDEQESGTIQIVLTAFGATCNSSDTLNVQVSSIFIEFNEEINACEGDNIWLAIAASPKFTYSWNTGDTGNQILVDAFGDEVYVATVSNGDKCSAEAVLRLSVDEKLVIGMSVDLENKLLTVAPAGLSRYDFFDEANNLLYSSTSNVYDYSSVANLINEIRVIGFDSNGCASDKETPGNTNVFVVGQLEKVNAFSPNSDGINDRLLPGRKTMVFDRAGKVLYEGWEGWDGIANGKKMPQGTYFYILYDGTNIFYKGPVTLLR